MYGHNYHFHIRLACPAGETDCQPQDPSAGGDGCGKELDYWFSDAVLHPKPPERKAEAAPRRWPRCPQACRAVLEAP